MLLATKTSERGSTIRMALLTSNPVVSNVATSEHGSSRSPAQVNLFPTIIMDELGSCISMKEPRRIAATGLFWLFPVVVNVLSLMINEVLIKSLNAASPLSAVLPNTKAGE